MFEHVLNGVLEKDGTLTEVGVAYLCNSSGQLDPLVVNRVLERWFSKNQLHVLALETYGTTTWKLPEYSTMTKDEFLAVYAFGAYEHISDWIPYLAIQYKKLITKKDLFSWVNNQ